MKLKLKWSIQKTRSHSLIPVFIPFAGCPTRCIFCAQDLQSGALQRPIQAILFDLESDLLQRQHKGQDAPELGFFGGTFTSIAPADFQLCCDFVQREIQSKRIAKARCSTRPDAINEEILNKLINSGFEMIELGVQSFNNKALQRSKRNYSEDTIKSACALIKSMGLKLGVQLMPGMPGVDGQTFLNDTKMALASGANILRFYPCQVLEGTQLAELWLNKQYEPWTLDKTIENLAKAWLLAHEKEVPVIRMGLAPEPSLTTATLAGPNHPALGSLVQAQALFLYIKQALGGKIVKTISLPKSCQGFLGGDKNMLWAQWEGLGILKENTSWHDEQYVYIVVK